MVSKTLIIGACGQIGSELTYKLRAEIGDENVIASDIKESNLELVNSGPFKILDAKNFDQIKECVEKNNVGTVYLMAAMLSATGEKFPEKAWDLNMTSLLNVLNLAKEKIIDRVFWPSSIAVFGPTTPKAAEESGLNIDISAPTSEAPSMTKALEIYIKKANKAKK